jgi:3-oxoacyl-[acyl-carrier-protein] synthase-3
MGVGVCTIPRAIRILGTGVARPSCQVESSELDTLLNLPEGTVQRVSGVRVRYVETRRTAASLGAEAARCALAAAGLTLEQIDCVVAASGSMDQAMPCNAALIHRELGLGGSGVAAFDINASCLGFLAALDTLSWPLLAGRYRHVLIVAADIASCALDWSELGASAIFGDGAAAVVIARDRDPDKTTPGILASAFATYSEGAHLCEIRAGGSRHHPSRCEPFDAFGDATGPQGAGVQADGVQAADAEAAGGQTAGVEANGGARRPADYLTLAQFRMDGQAVFHLVARHLDGFVDALLHGAGLGRGDLTLVVPHQASHLGLRYLTRLGFPRDRIVNIYADHGNQVAASLPSALHAAIRGGALRRGDTALLLGTGAGVSFGGIVLRY